jgi:hypothetical protein
MRPADTGSSPGPGDSAGPGRELIPDLVRGARRRAAAIRRGDAMRRARSIARGLLPSVREGTVRTHLLDPSRQALALTELDLHALRERSQREVLEVLESTDAMCPIVVPSAPRRSTRLAVRAENRERALGALAELPAHWEIREDDARSRIEAVPHYAVGDEILEDVRDLTVRIDLLRPSADGYRGSGYGSYDFVRADDWVELAAASRRPAARRLGPPEPDVQVDAVFTWVDGADPDWVRRRDAALAGVVGGGGQEAQSLSLHPTSTDASRFQDSEELRYSLRSVHAYASWVRRIHIVTDSQVPSWLDVSHPKIRIVDHSEILGGSRFNSHAIEAGLHRIPALADHYLYLNDDVFFGRIAYCGDFFAAPGIVRFFPSDLPIDPGPPHPEDLPIVAAAKNNRDLVRERFGLDVRTKIRHTVHPQLRRVNRLIDEDFPARMAATRASLFRAPTDLSVASSLHHWYAYALSRAVPDTPNYLYLDLSDPHAGQTLDALASLHRYDTFCLNQERSDAATDQGVREMRRFLPRFLPLPAPWENDA